MVTEDKPPKKNIMGTIYEIISVIAFLIVSYLAYDHKDISELYKWGIIPLFFFSLSIFYRLNEIGIAFVAMFEYMDSIGINGLPAIAILLLVALTITNLFSTEKLWSEMMKIVAGIASGSLAQAKISIHQAKKQTK